MASRIAEVVYKLRDLFTGPAKNVEGGYEGIRRESRRAADSVQRDSNRMAGAFDRIAGGLKKFRGGFAVFAAGGLLVSGLKSLANEFDRVGKLADRLDLDPATLSAFGYAAARSGVEVSTMEKALVELQKRTGEAAQGMGEAGQAFATLGINAEEFIKLGLEEQMTRLADGFSIITEEETKAALAARVFGEAGGEVLQALSGGSAAFGEVLRQGREFTKVTKEAAEAAAEFKGSMVQTGAIVDSFVVKIGTPALQAVNSFFNGLGLGTDELKRFEKRMASAQARLETAEFFGWDAGAERARAELDSLQAELDQYIIKTTQAQAAEDGRKRTLQVAAAANTAYQASVEALTKAYDDQAKVRGEALKKETAELASARQQQKSIEAEFAKLSEDVTKPKKEKVVGLDVQTATLEARRKLAAGDTDGAIKAARDGSDLLRQLHSQGEEAGYVLSFLAKQLGEVANKAAGQQVDVEIVDEQKAQQALAGVANKADALKTDMVAKGTDIGKAFVAAINAGIASEPLQTPGPLVRAPDIVREGNSFSHSMRRELDRRGAK